MNERKKGKFPPQTILGYVVARLDETEAVYVAVVDGHVRNAYTVANTVMDEFRAGDIASKIYPVFRTCQGA